MIIIKSKRVHNFEEVKQDEQRASVMLELGGLEDEPEIAELKDLVTKRNQKKVKGILLVASLTFPENLTMKGNNAVAYGELKRRVEIPKRSRRGTDK